MSFEYNGFKYWDKEHYVVSTVSGTLEQCLDTFREQQSIYPTFQFGTHISKKSCDHDQCSIEIRRFKTKDLCKKHLEFPPTYVREGKVL